MDIRVKFFAYARSAAGRKEMTVKVKEGTTLKELREKILDDIPELKKYRAEINLAINHEYADPDSVLKEGDEVAFLPPVSGG